MSMSIFFHCADGLFVSGEFPENSLSVTLSDNAGSEVTYYPRLEDWWILRSLPKGPGYSMGFFDEKNQVEILHDHAKADDFAKQIYESAKAAPPPPHDPEPEAIAF